MTYIPIRKGSLLIPSGPRKHLHIICNNPVFYPKIAKDSFLAVNISSIRNDIEHDPTCTFGGGEHPFIKHPSYVFYGEAEVYGVATTCNKVASGEFTIHQNMDDIPFNQLLDGFAISQFVVPKIKNYYQKYCK